MAGAKVGVKELGGSLGSAIDCDPEQDPCPLEPSVYSSAELERLW